MLQLIIFIIYTILILLVNYLFKKHKETGKQVYEIIGGLIFLFITILLVGIITPIYLALIDRINLQMWPNNLLFTLGLLIIFYLFARTEMLSDIVSSGRRVR